jgi:hypothetical protein
VQENKRLSHLKGEQEVWLLVLEQAVRTPGKQSKEDGKKDAKSMENHHPVSQETMTDPNRVLKEQLAQLQDDNMKLTITLLAEQNVKKELAKKLGQLQENLTTSRLS